MGEIEKAYIAGLVDGEGSVTLSRKQRNETPSPEVSIANNNLQLLDWVKNIVGAGKITSKSKNKIYHAQSYTWSIRDNKAICFLNGIKNYLIVKRQQAELITRKYKVYTPRNGKYTPEMLRGKLELVAQNREIEPAINLCLL